MTTNTNTNSAQTEVDAAQAVIDAHHKIELAMVERMTALDAEEKRLKEIITSAKSALVDAMAAGNTKASVADVTAAQMKLDAIAEVRSRFPDELRAHRERGGRITARLMAAQRSLKAAQLDDAIADYRKAMTDVWRLAETVWDRAHAAGLSTLDGMADPFSPRYGRA